MTRHRKVRVIYVLELVFALGIGLALARARLDIALKQEMFEVDAQGEWIEIPYPLLTQLAGAAESVLAGAVLVGCSMTWFEKLRGRSPDPWGPGRWAWSILGIYLVFKDLQIGLDWAVAKFAHGKQVGCLHKLAEEQAEGFAINASCILLALVPTYWASAGGRKPTVDDRELAGWCIAVSIVVLWIAFEIARFFGTPSLNPWIIRD